MASLGNAVIMNFTFSEENFWPNVNYNAAISQTSFTPNILSDSLFAQNFSATTQQIFSFEGNAFSVNSLASLGVNAASNTFTANVLGTVEVVPVGNLRITEVGKKVDYNFKFG